MPKMRLPDLPDTGRHYVENTVRARLASPGVERYRRAGGNGSRLALAAVAIAALVAAMLWLAR
ncbi:MAG TPA: hypothetical protein VF841_19665 [Anaeromyxobacter sp.]